MRTKSNTVCFDERQPSYVNADFILNNGTDKDVRVTQLRGLVFNEKGELIERRIAWQQALSYLGHGNARSVGAGKEALIYNPFHFDSVKSGTRIRYEIDFADGTPSPPAVQVVPQTRATKARLVLPVAGRVAVLDGHDTLPHHRRSGYLGPESKSLGIIDNAQRFGLDLVVIDPQGRQFRGGGRRNEDFYGWRQPIRSPAAGVVAAVHDGQPDNDQIGCENLWTQRSMLVDEMTSAGNYVLIDHGAGEFSLLSHLKKGSVRVRKGDRVRSAQIIGEMGKSGASLGPHLHYELRSGWGARGIRTMPAAFHRLKVLGTGETAGREGVAVNTGDILIAK